MKTVLLLMTAANWLYFTGDKLWLGDALREAEPRPTTFKTRVGAMLQSAAFVLLLATLVVMLA